MAVRLALLWVLLVLVECFMRSTKLQVLVLIILLLLAGCGSSDTSSPLVTPTTGSSVNTFNESAVPTSKSFCDHGGTRWQPLVYRGQWP
jgi:hypothetical protein